MTAAGPFVDAHTHAIFAGDRANEFEQRLEGADYLEILRSGGGILNTVQATRQAPDSGTTPTVECVWPLQEVHCALVLNVSRTTQSDAEY